MIAAGPHIAFSENSSTEESMESGALHWCSSANETCQKDPVTGRSAVVHVVSCKSTNKPMQK